MTKKLKVERAMLVYQAGLANVFWVQSFNLADYGRDARRLIQSDFRLCEAYAKGLAHAGAVVRTAHCNEAGDITHSHWSDDLSDAPFADKLSVVNMN